MHILECREAPIRVFGLLRIGEGSLRRLPEALMDQLPHIRQFGSRSTGGRICFRTNSRKLWVQLESQTFIRDYAATQIASSGLDVFIGDRPTCRLAGSVFPTGFRGTDPKRSEKEFALPGTMTDVTIYFPKNEQIESVHIGIDDDAAIEAPTPYRNEKPVLFYGSSITEGGCASRVGNTYNALLSRWLNMDYLNFGFSGSALGEPEMAELIAGLPLSAFVYDYDYNAPTVAHLAATHEPFFRIIREKQPELPILILSRPNYAADPAESDQRAAVIRRTYENAVARGDKNVWFIHGRELLGDENPLDCTVDLVHPNDLGFYRMAKVLRPVMASLLEAAEAN